MANRNTEINTSSLPAIYTNRSRHHYYKNIKTSINEGDLVPFYANQLVQPGDTFNIILSLVARLTTPYQPVMDNCYLDTYCFKVEWLDIWEHTKEFWGQNTQGAWISQTEYELPSIIVSGQTFSENYAKDFLKTPVSYMHIAQPSHGGQDYQVFGALPVRAYLFTWNEYFRDQNYIPPIYFSTNDENTRLQIAPYYGQNRMPTYGTAASGGCLLRVAKMHDRFTSGLPQPAGNEVGIPLGTTAPVIGNGKTLGITDGTTTAGLMAGFNSSATNSSHALSYNETALNQTLPTENYTSQSDMSYKGIGITTNAAYSGLVADLTNAVSAALSAQRIALALNHIEEKLGMYGRRLREIYRACWGVDSNDTAQHIPEYLGGKRTLVNMSEVLATTAGDNQDIGSTGANSLTSDVYEFCNKSFTEHSVILGLVCLRCEQHNGSQGIDRQFLKSRKYDFYWDDLAGLSFQPVYNGEILWKNRTTVEDDSGNMEPHHYLPSWEEYRRETDYMSGMFNPYHPQWLGQWTYTRQLKFPNLPAMGQDWIEEDKAALDRTLTDTSAISDHCIIDFELEVTKYSIVKQYGVPGIDKF